jgi:hypothetical protein
VVGDWAGRGHAGIGVVDSVSATWYLADDAGGPPGHVFLFGIAGYRPVAGDWTGSGHATVGAVDPATMNWYVTSANPPASPAATAPFQYGGAGWAAVTADWDGSGRSGIAAVSPDGIWYLRSNGRR